jgi:hypothetical protein
MSGPPIVGLTLRRASRTGLLSAVLAAAVVTFVVSLSIAIGLNLTKDSAAQPERLSAASESEHSAAAPTVRPRPAAPPPVAFPDASRALAKTMIVKAPPASPAPPPVAEPVYAPPPAATPPAYQAPAPVYVPPPPKPRLRDRIIERIPIIGRFHEPGQ